MRALRDKKGMIAQLIIVVSVAALLGSPVLAAKAPVRGKKPTAAAADPEIYRVVPQKCMPAKGQFVWNFEEEELINILRQVSDLLCKTIVVNDAINKNMKLTIIGKSPLTPKDAWDVLMASMAAKGLALIEQGKTWTVIKRAESKSYSTPFYSGASQAHNNEEIGTLFYKAEHATPDALRNIAKMLISKDGMVEPVGDQFIIVIDSNSNIKRLGRIFSQVDVEDAINKIHILKIEHADAKTVEKQLRELFDISSGGGGPGGPRRRRPGEEGKSTLNIKKVIVDDRTNSIIVEADLDSFERLKEVVALIDQPVSDQSSKGKIHVYRLRFADAKKVAETLTNVVKQGGSRRSRFGRRGDEESNELFEGEVQITAHESSNTVVAVATQNDWKSTLLPTIIKLDARRDQVYIEAVIMDIKVNDSSDFGINLFSGLNANIPGIGSSLGLLANPGGKSMVSGMVTTMTQGGAATSDVAGLGKQSLGALAVLGNFVNSGVLGIVGPPVGTTNIPSFGAVLQALSTNSNVDILSTPYLLTSDNQEAVMSVGEKIPVLKGTTLGGGGIAAGLVSQNIQHEDVKLTFKVTPHVGADDNVRLDIDQEVNELGTSEEINNQKQYRINTKTAKTTIVLKDQQTGVIGGLMHNKNMRADTKTPFLGDIPILGWLFKTRRSNSDRHSLVLVITPYVIKTDDDYRKIVEKKLKERDEFANLYFGGKIKNYNPYVDYDKKRGPISTMLLEMDAEMKKPENGGPGEGNETIITPQESAPKSPPEAPEASGGTALLQNEFGGDDGEAGAEVDFFAPESAPVVPVEVDG